MPPRPAPRRGVALIMFHQSCDLLYRWRPRPNIAAARLNAIALAFETASPYRLLSLVWRVTWPSAAGILSATCTIR